MSGEIIRDQGGGNWLYRPPFPAHWSRAPLYSLAKWVNGLAFRDIQFSASGMPVIKIAEIKGGISNQTKFTEQEFGESVRVKPGDMLFSWSGQPETSIDVSWWRGPEGWLNQHVFLVTPSPVVNNTFLYYLLRYLRPNFVGIARNKQTTGLGHVTRRDLENIEAAYPSINEQRAIAFVLGALDDKIELNRRRNRTLEAIAQTMFASWFEQIGSASAAAADMISERLLEIGDGYRAKIAELATDGLPFVRAGDLNSGFDLDGAERLGRASLPKAGNKLSRAGDVAFTSKGTVGRLARVGESTPQFVYSPQVCFWRSLDPTKLHPAILYCWMSSTNFSAQVLRVSGQTDMAPYISLRDQRAIEVPRFPPSQSEIGETVARLLRRVECSTAESRALAALRDALLPILISGELRVVGVSRGAPAQVRGSSVKKSKEKTK